MSSLFNSSKNSLNLSVLDSSSDGSALSEYVLGDTLANIATDEDFDDLIALTYRLLDENPELAKATSQKYQYIMVDEY